LKKIVYITGTRADYGLMSSVLKKIQDSKELDLTLIVTGMHLMPEFGNTINEIKKDGYRIEIIDAVYEKDNLASTLKFLGKFIDKLTDKLKKIKPDVLLILGDRAEMLAGAVAGQYLNIPVAHISGGDITGHVDDTIRQAITKLSHIHFPICEKSAERIIKMGENKNRVFIAGATSLDNIKSAKLPEKNTLFKKYKIDKSSRYVIIIQHPVITESDQAKKHMKNILDAITDLKIQSIVIYPNADAGGKKIISVIEKYRKHDYIKIYPNIPYLDYLGLYKHASAILGNSSSAIVESSSFGVPAINIGVRQKGREKAENVINISYDKKEIIKALKKALFNKKFKQKCRSVKSPYGNGTAGEKIIDILTRLKLNEYLLDKNSRYRVLRPNFKRFNDFKKEDTLFDFHVHTSQTDGKNTSREMIEQAEKLKLKSIAFTEHVNRTSNWYYKFFSNIEDMRKKRNIDVLIGIEAKPVDFQGTLDASQDIIKKSEIIVGSVHRYPDEKGGLIELSDIKNLGEKKAAEIEFKLLMGLLKNKQIDILGHPFGVYSKFFNNFQEDYMEKLIKKVTETDIAFEINTKYNTNYDKLCKLLKKYNPYISIGSDAHNVKEIANSFDEVKKVIIK
jgi:UDP-hydrolysing UDP-N-acetyl-D-glucosamine 2-epimerase